jgi:hypothetical protein
MRREISAQCFERIPADALNLRASRFPAPDGSLVGGDEFDDRAPGVFSTWSKGAAEVPSGPDIADLGRCCVHPDYRRLELLRSVGLEGLIHSFSLNMAHVNGAHVPGRFLAASSQDMGFRSVGPCVESFEPNGNKTYQPVSCDLKSSADLWPAHREPVENHLAAHGFSLHLELPSTVRRDHVALVRRSSGISSNE